MPTSTTTDDANILMAYYETVQPEYATEERVAKVIEPQPTQAVSSDTFSICAPSVSLTPKVPLFQAARPLAGRRQL